MNASDFTQRLKDRTTDAGVSISPVHLKQLEEYFQLLSRWNTRMNLTALPLNPLSDHAMDRLFVEPLAAAQFVPEGDSTWFDFGSGGGSPALPMKIVRRDARLTMVEAKSRKAAFLREAVRTLGFKETNVEHERFETVSARAEVVGRADLVTVRAVKADQVLFDAARALLRPNGRLFLFQSTNETVEVRDFDTRRTVALLRGDGNARLVELARK